VQGQPVELSILRVAGGREPFVDWFQRLGNPVLKARVMQRLDRLQAGNPGDCRSLGAGLLELRIDTGPGYRVYFSLPSPGHCLILCAGSKRTQATDIERAKKWLEEARRRPSE
jgi:putative addiction module killer protein